jgi:hypothetical protein
VVDEKPLGIIDGLVEFRIRPLDLHPDRLLDLVDSIGRNLRAPGRRQQRRAGLEADEAATEDPLGLHAVQPGLAFARRCAHMPGIRPVLALPHAAPVWL